MLKEVFEELINDPEFPQDDAWRWRAYREQEIVFQKGDTGRKIYLVKSGKLRITGKVELDNGKQVSPGLSDLGPGDLLGEVTLFGDRPRTATVTALTEAELLEIDCIRLIDYMENHKDTGYDLIKAIFQILVERFGKNSERMEYFIGWGLKARGIDKHL